MRFREALQVRLQQRYRRLYKSGWQTFGNEVQLFLTWLDEVPAIRSIVAALERSSPDLDPETWWKEVDKSRQPQPFATEEARAKAMLFALRGIGEVSGSDWSNRLYRLTDESSVPDVCRSFCDRWVEPVVEYLQERLGAESDILYLLERYGRRVAWFEQQRLHDAYLADTTRGEATYEKDLRHFLFEQGIDYPFSQPEGPSGKADVVALVDSDDPLTCEVKLYDGTDRGVPYLAKGVHQAWRYAEDYGKTAAYLVVFNLTQDTLDLPSDDPDAGWPRRIQVGEITVFFVVVQAAPREKASRAGASRTVRVEKADLVTEIDGSDS